tara:strand:+ start:349 stop:849 length:501 start_codon:yes stop_codon:yes gene_type:complete
MKRLLLASLLIWISFLNMGFMFKNILLRGIVCDYNRGDINKFKSFPISEQYKKNNYVWIYDEKSGELYRYDDFLEKMVLLGQYEEFDGETNEITKKEHEAIIVNNKLKVKWKYTFFDQNNIQEGVYKGQEIIDLKTLINTYKETGKEDQKIRCETFELPKNLEIVK